LGNQDFTILVVDDNELNRDVLSRRLERQGYRVLAVEDGQLALDTVANVQIDLILLDIMMPGLTGVEVLRILRQRFGPTDLPIIMCTARTDSGDMVEALELGANDYVTKPLDFPVVLARVQSQLRARRAPRHVPPPSIPLSVADIKLGVVLAEKYRLDREIGKGAFGAVYQARHLSLDRDVAVKVLQTSAARTSDGLARFQREGISACRIQHPNAVSVLDFGVTSSGGIAYLVMELLSGHSLEEELVRVDGVFSPLRCSQILTPVCGVLADAHAMGIVHRDIKPANIFLHHTRQAEVIKVLDFGIAKILDSSASQNLTLEGGILGTPSYMAPERFGSTGVIDGKSDVYSVGVMLFEMLAGRLPFVSHDSNPLAVAMMHVSKQPPSLCDVNPEVPSAVEAVVLQALRKDPAQRPDIATLAASFNRALGLVPELPEFQLGSENLIDPIVGPSSRETADIERPKTAIAQIPRRQPPQTLDEMPAAPDSADRTDPTS